MYICVCTCKNTGIEVGERENKLNIKEIHLLPFLFSLGLENCIFWSGMSFWQEWSVTFWIYYYIIRRKYLSSYPFYADWKDEKALTSYLNSVKILYKSNANLEATNESDHWGKTKSEVLFLELAFIYFWESEQDIFKFGVSWVGFNFLNLT